MSKSGSQQATEEAEMPRTEAKPVEETKPEKVTAHCPFCDKERINKDDVKEDKVSVVTCPDCKAEIRITPKDKDGPILKECKLFSREVIVFNQLFRKISRFQTDVRQQQLDNDKLIAAIAEKVGYGGPPGMVISDEIDGKYYTIPPKLDRAYRDILTKKVEAKGDALAKLEKDIEEFRADLAGTWPQVPQADIDALMAINEEVRSISRQVTEADIEAGRLLEKYAEEHRLESRGPWEITEDDILRHKKEQTQGTGRR